MPYQKEEECNIIQLEEDSEEELYTINEDEFPFDIEEGNSWPKRAKIGSWICFGLGILVPLLSVFIAGRMSIALGIVCVALLCLGGLLHSYRVGTLTSQALPIAVGVVLTIAIVTGYCFREMDRLADVRHKREVREAAERARGPVYNSEWDGSVYQVKAWLDRNIADPDYEIMEWGPVIKNTETFRYAYMVRCNVRARNALGGYIIKPYVFQFTTNGDIIKVD